MRRYPVWRIRRSLPERVDISGHSAFRTCTHVEIHPLIRMKGSQADIPEPGEMREHIGTSIVRDDEPAAFRIAEPSYRASMHSRFYESYFQRGWAWRSFERRGLGLNRKSIKKSPGDRASSQRLADLLGADVDRLLAFRPGRHVESDALRFFQGFEPAVLYRREMREKVLATAIGGDEAEAFRVVEPLNRTCTHLDLPLSC